MFDAEYEHPWFNMHVHTHDEAKQGLTSLLFTLST